MFCHHLSSRLATQIRSMFNISELVYIYNTLNLLMAYVILKVKKAPTPKWMLRAKGLMSLRTPPLLWVRQEGHFYLCLFLLSRKVSNATISPPKEISKANIHKKIIMISYAVVCATSLPMYSGYPVFIGSGGYHPVMCTFLKRL